MSRPDDSSRRQHLGVFFLLTNAALDLAVYFGLFGAMDYFGYGSIWLSYAMLLGIPWAVGARGGQKGVMIQLMEGTAMKPSPRPRLWYRLSIPTGNTLQALGCATGIFLLRRATLTQDRALMRVARMILGWLAIYVCSHASAHYLVGRAFGIRFVGYGVRGSDHPEDSPPGLRELTRVTPFFTAITDKESMRAAAPLARALMFSAGETSSTISSLLAAGYAWRHRVPGGAVFFVVLLIWMLAASVVTSVVPRGDYAKARAALRSKWRTR